MAKILPDTHPTTHLSKFKYKKEKPHLDDITFKFEKEEPDVEISLSTPPLPAVYNDLARFWTLRLVFSGPADIMKRKGADPEPVDMLSARRTCLPSHHNDPLVHSVDTSVFSDGTTADSTDAELLVRKSRIEAARRVQSPEIDLCDQAIVTLIELFEVKPEAGDIYLSLTREIVRKE
ncbi:hypothetical protein CVT26_011921 [Gymnopilus dilepis]|uniref:Uncharacterized protein n=1 Tax=Gymnopilus dilepis TaxID=231916 RepID=A0A409WX83_9AGAR|nr:hypothetical protein CVT26_011921 [Gymnopilus dilepis]